MFERLHSYTARISIGIRVLSLEDHPPIYTFGVTSCFRLCSGNVFVLIVCAITESNQAAVECKGIQLSTGMSMFASIKDTALILKFGLLLDNNGHYQCFLCHADLGNKTTCLRDEAMYTSIGRGGLPSNEVKFSSHVVSDSSCANLQSGRGNTRSLGTKS